MWGAIAGDIIGSVYEHYALKKEDFQLWDPEVRITDDTVLTVAVAHAILTDGDYGAAIKTFGRRYPHAGYGGSFKYWLRSDSYEPYNSWGNGSAMRVSPVGFAFDNLETVLVQAEKSAAVTHNHPEGIKGAQAVALAVYLARTGADKKEIRSQVSTRFGYDLSRSLAEIRPDYQFDVSCQGSVPQAITAFLESVSVEDAIRKAVSLGGDSDTLACIAGVIAEAACGGVPEEMQQRARELLPQDLLEVVDCFQERFGI
jgi:ADP-ribosylglycohydrolase